MHVDRRHFLALGVALMAEPRPSQRNRRIEVWQGGEWRRTLMIDIKKGDCFRVDDLRGEFLAASDAQLNGLTGIWGVQIEEVPHAD